MAGNLCESGHRIATMALVISCHLSLLMLLLVPVKYHRGITSVAESASLGLKLRFIRQPQQTSPRLALPAFRSTALTPRVHRALPEGRGVPKPPTGRAARVAVLPFDTYFTSRRTTLITPNQYKDNVASTSDGGFRERLLDAQNSHAVHGLPGSDAPFVSGIQLINPMNKGVGGVMRAAQRLFGVTNRHCIDADVWRNHSPKEVRELIAQHILPIDVGKIDEQYDCNRPLRRPRHSPRF